MSYNGSGTFQINTSGQPVVTGTVISSSAFNALTADLATGLSTAITKDGQTATTVRIPFAQGINSSLATDTTSGSTGSIYTAGGVGIAKALFVGTTLNYGGVTLSAAVTGTGKMVLDNTPTLTTPTLTTPNITTGLKLTNAAGTIGQVLTSAGASAAPIWTTPSTASGTVTSVATGTGLTGGPITSTGTIAIDSTVATLTGTQTLTNKTIQGGAITSGTVVASTSGTSIDFTSIPSWVKRITVMFDGVSTNGSSPVQIQLGDSGGAETSGYTGSVSTITNSVATFAFSAGFLISSSGGESASTVRYGALIISKLNNNLYTGIGNFSYGSSDTRFFVLAGTKNLSDVLDRVRITTVNGTDTFDAGSVNILYEG